MRFGRKSQAVAVIAILLVIFFVPLVPVTVHLGLGNYSFSYTEFRSLGCAAIGLGAVYAPGLLGYDFCAPVLP